MSQRPHHFKEDKKPKHRMGTLPPVRGYDPPHFQDHEGHRRQSGPAALSAWGHTPRSLFLDCLSPRSIGLTYLLTLTYVDLWGNVSDLAYIYEKFKYLLCDLPLELCYL
jgi:hypothetical protein